MARVLVPAMIKAHMSGVAYVAQNFPGRTFTLVYIDGTKESATIESREKLPDIPDEGEECEHNFFAYVSAVQDQRARKDGEIHE